MNSIRPLAANGSDEVLAVRGAPDDYARTVTLLRDHAIAVYTLHRGASLAVENAER